MKLLRYKSVLASAAIFMVIVLLVAMQGQKMDSAKTLPQRQVQDQYQQHLQQFLEESKALHRAIEHYARQGEPARLEASREQFIVTKEAFKKAEYLAAYYDPEYVTNYFNGAPLPSLEDHAPDMVVLEPEGLQILEEVLFGEMNEPAAIGEATTLSRRLVRTIEDFMLTQKGSLVQDRHVFEAVRLALVRAIAMGVTGFDSPMLLRSLPETKAALASAFEALEAYQPALRERDRKLARRLRNQCRATLRYLEKHDNFEEFDRLAFLKKHLNPLFADVLAAQQALYIETVYEVSPRKQSLNHLSNNIFAEDFLNPYYYLQGTEQLYSDSQVIALGQKLFYDPVLSKNNQRSCASCHHPAKAFTDGQKTSLAFNFEGNIQRNAPTLINSVYAEQYFHDLREDFLEHQIEHVIADPHEFRTDYKEILAKLEQSAAYREAFAAAFPRREDAQAMNPATISKAIAAYVNELRGFDSPFDRYVRNETASIDPAVERGFNLFMGKAACATCHFPPTFSGLVPPLYHESESEVLGVPATPDTLNPELDPDLGRYAGKFREASEIYRHAFKTPTVRNAELTAPYMHNGVYENMEQLMDFYNHGGGAGMGLDVPNQTLPPDPLNLSQREQQDIIAFMEALTDTAGMPGAPQSLPEFPGNESLNQRSVGGVY